MLVMMILGKRLVSIAALLHVLRVTYLEYIPIDYKLIHNHLYLD